MGKTSKANRTKGNTRPSSSGHSAQLLGFSGGALSGFIGFEALEKETPSYVPVTGQHTADATDNTVDSDFRMVMRKMLKRDAVTRLKAMQEFGEHCVEKEKDIVKNVLPFWPRLFNRLALDCDRRIREATHQSNGKLLSKVKREMAPYLKNIMGVWLLGQCDLYAPAASAAQTTFSTTFPLAKQSEALMFCKSEIFSYFKDNLFEQTAKSMSEPNSTTPEDMENKYNLMISATLQALKLFLTTVKPSEYDNIHEDFCSLASENKFWKYAKNKEAQIRGAWYALISSICQLKPNVLKDMEKKLATTVFSYLSESDPMVAPSIWESALSIVVNFENCWQGIDIHKVALPQLWSLLKEGGKGNARVLFPCLLPFLSKLPKEIVETENFLTQFFSCFRQSLSLDSVKNSPIECDSILLAFLECLQFICCNRLGDVETGPILLEKILMNEIVPLLESSIYDMQNSHLATSKLYPLLGSLIGKMENQCNSKNQVISQAFSKVLTEFWQQVFPILCKIFTVPDQKKSMCLVFLAYFFNSLLQSSDCLIKRAKRTVRFEEDCTEDDLLLKERPPPDKSDSSNLLSNKKSQSFIHIVKFCEQLCKEIDGDCKLGYMKLLEEVMSSASSEDFVLELVKILSVERKYDSESTEEFFKEVVLKWIQRVKSDYECLSCMFNIVFIICSFVSKDEARKILNCCSKMHVKLLEHLLRRGLGTYRNEPFFQNWLRSSLWCSEVVRGLTDLISGKKFFSDHVSESEMEVYQRILKICLLDSDTTLLINDANLENVVHLLTDLSEQLSSTKMSERNSNLVLYFIHDISIAILKNPKRSWKFEAVENFLDLLFRISLKDVLSFENPDKASRLLFEILNTFVDSYIEVKEEITNDASLIFRIANELNLYINSLKTEEEALHVLHHCLTLLSSVETALSNHKPGLNSTLFVSYKLMDTILPSLETWNSLKEGLTINILPSFMKKKIFYPLSMDEQFFYPEDSVLKLKHASEVISSVLCSNTMHSDFGDESEKFHVNYINEHIPYLLWSLTFFKATRIASEVGKELFDERLEQNCLKMLSFLHPSDIEALRQKIFDLSLLDGQWALCLQILGDIFPASDLCSCAEKEFESTSFLNLTENVHKYLVQQVLIPYLSTEKKQLHFKRLLVDIMNMDGRITDEHFAGKMGEMCCCLQSGELDLPVGLQGDLMMLLHVFINPDFQDRNELKTMHHLQMMSILSSTMQYDICLVSDEIWEFYEELLSTLQQECKSKTCSTPKDFMTLYLAVSIFSILSRLLCMMQNGSSIPNSSWSPPPMPTEIYMQFINVFIQIGTDVHKKLNSLSEMCDFVLTNLLEAANFIPAEELLNVLILPEPDAVGEDNSLEYSSLHGIVLMMMSDCRQIQFASYIILFKVMPLVPDFLMEKLSTQSEEDSEEDVKKIPHKLGPLIKILKYLNDLVESMLSDVQIGDLCTVVPQTDSYVFATSYLLSWIVLLEFISSSPSQIRLGYATYLEEEMKLLSSLLSNVFRFMPENPILCLKKGRIVETPKKEDLKALFTHPPFFRPVAPTAEEMQCIACYVFSTALRKVPASVRTWWNNLDRKSADIVNSFTTKYVSGPLCIAEIQAVHENEKQFENLMVQARPGSREVIATYTIDDCAIELCVQLPANYPLGPISAERRGKVVIGQLEWRHWLMQLTTVLSYQNGSILDGLTIWKRNLDKKFEGVEECMICYYILHSSTLKLPKLSCHVCRKKFHSACLYKWFRTSNNFTCPLCRNEFAM